MAQIQFDSNRYGMNIVIDPQGITYSGSDLRWGYSGLTLGSYT